MKCERMKVNTTRRRTIDSICFNTILLAYLIKTLSGRICFRRLFGPLVGFRTSHAPRDRLEGNNILLVVFFRRNFYN